MGKRKRNQYPLNNEIIDTSTLEDPIKTENNDTASENKPAENENKTTEKPEVINKRARIIVRNLSFKTTAAKLKKHFETYGPVHEVNLLKRSDGKLVGCAFIQFKVVQNAAKAIYHTTGKPFLDRPIICDWAMGKNTYIHNIKEALEKEIKDEPDETETVPEPVDGEALADEIKEEVKSECDKESVKSASENDEASSDEESEDSEEENSDEEEDEVKDEPEEKKPRFVSNDVQEGKTVFIKNVPFSATNEDLKQCMYQFGPIYYGLICVDPVTEYSKGTAFVKFFNQEDAEKCLQAGTELTLMGNVLDCHRAVGRGEIGNKHKKKDEKKDSRNLYLVKEGVILAGTKAAEGVSAADMAKRLELERWKTQMLRNLNMYISRNRLVIQNLPPTFDDSKVRQLFTKFGGPKAVIREARVLRDMRNLDSSGIGKSKEFAFVTFEDHEDALRALRALNNNPDVFSKTKRPIVAFSIENRSVINAKNQRMIRSKLNNPNHKDFDPNASKTNAADPKKKNTPKKASNSELEQSDKKFVGVTAKPGISKMRSRYKLRTQAQLHHENLKKQKKKQKFAKKTLQQKKQDFIRQPGQKQNTKKKKDGEDGFSKMVNKHKKNLSAQTKTTKKNKWYNDSG